MNRMFVVLLLTVIILLLDLYAYQAIKTVSSNSSQSNKQIIKLVYFTISALVIISVLLYNFGDPDKIAKHARTFLMSFIFINVLAKLFLSIFMLFDDIQRAIRWIIAKFSSDSNIEGEPISRSKFLATTGLIVAAAPIVSLSWGIISGAHDYRVRRIKLPIKGLSNRLEGFTITQLSDIHSGSFWNRTAVKRGIEMVNAEKSDLLLFTGDLVNNKSSEMSEWGDLFSKLKAPYGVYSVLGNHDYGDYVSWDSETAKRNNLKNLADIQKNMGWRLLRNENVSLDIEGEKIGLIGVENWSSKGRFAKYGDLNEAVKGLDETNGFNILMSHDPSHWQAEVLQQQPKINLTLSGHTHGMQFGVEIPGFKWSPVQYMYKEWAGLYKSAEQFLYVNRGFGYIGYPGRFGILPEITVITLERA